MFDDGAPQSGSWISQDFVGALVIERVEPGQYSQEAQKAPAERFTVGAILDPRTDQRAHVFSFSIPSIN